MASGAKARLFLGRLDGGAEASPFRLLDHEVSCCGGLDMTATVVAKLLVPRERWRTEVRRYKTWASRAEFWYIWGNGKALSPPAENAK